MSCKYCIHRKASYFSELNLTYILSFHFCLIRRIAHVLLEALKSIFEVILVNDAIAHGVGKSQLVLSNSLRKELSNDIPYGLFILR